jgi:hypothetical protein
MGFVERVQRWIRGGEPTLVDYETYEQSVAPGAGQPDGGGRGAMGGAGPMPPELAGEGPAGGGGPMGAGMAGAYSVLGRVGITGGGGGGPLGTGSAVGPGGSGGAAGGAGGTGGGAFGGIGANPAGTYKIQQSYDALLQTVQDLRAALDGQARRQEELFDRLSTLPQVAEALPQTSKMQADMLRMINDRLAMHADQQRKVQEVMNAGGGPVKKEYGEALQSIREQIEMGNEIDRQLVESFNRFSMMIDRLQLANQHAVDALQQVRDSYAASAMQMHEWIEKSRNRSGWMIGGAFLMAAASLAMSILMAMRLAAMGG